MLNGEEFLETIENEATQTKLGDLVAGKELDVWFNEKLSNDIKWKKKHVEVMVQDLINYKLGLH